MSIQPDIPIDVVDLIPVLNKKLLELLKSLTPDDWNKQTITKLLIVKDVTAHLLDGNIRLLSILRDDYKNCLTSRKPNIFLKMLVLLLRR